MEKDRIGTNAGVIWRALYERKVGTTFAHLMTEIDLPAYDVAAAIGWLAREGKIFFSYTNDGREVFSVYQECYY